MRFYTIFFIFLFFISCNSDREELQSLDEVIDRLWAENIRTFNGVINRVEDAGNRRRDVLLVTHGRQLFKTRKELRIPELSDSLQVDFNDKLIIDYLNSAHELINIYEIPQRRIDNVVNDVNKFVIDRQLENRKILIALLLLESEIFEKMARMVGSLCIFCYTFNFSTNSETVKVGDNHESIISIRDLINSSNNFSYDSLVISRNGRQIEFDSRPLGSSVYTKFQPSEPGEHLISGILTTSFEDSEWQMKCGFQFSVMVLEN